VFDEDRPCCGATACGILSAFFLSLPVLLDVRVCSCVSFLLLLLLLLRGWPLVCLWTRDKNKKTKNKEHNKQVFML